MHDSVSMVLDEIELSGSLEVPADARGLVLFVHGSGSSRLSPRNAHVARCLREAQLGTLLFDLLTAGEERLDARTGGLRFDIPLLTDRLIAATRWVQREPELARLPLGYFGASTGAAAALCAAALLQQVGAVVSRGGRPDLAADALARVSAATLLIVGGQDTQVLGLNRSALAQMTCEAQLTVVPGATHLFEEEGALEQVASLAADWFARHLRPATCPAK
jgi:pimeloyl-ACP methyl ester carboxylesterase